MSKVIVCREVGFECDAVVRADTVDEALAIAAAHVQRDHAIADVTPELVELVITRIHDESAPVAAAS